MGLRGLCSPSAPARVWQIGAAPRLVDVFMFSQEFLVRALDQFGNVDDSFEREVTLDSDNAPPGMQLENDGIVRLLKGKAGCRCTIPGCEANQVAPNLSVPRIAEQR